MTFFSTILYSFLSVFFMQSHEHNLTVVFSDIESTQGNLMIRVRNEARENVLLKVHPVKKLKENLSFKLPAGSYAIDVYHDKNANTELDKNLVGMPTEKYGFSNNPSATFGPPAFNEQLVKLDQDRTIEIILR